jgi:hypothetical protein
MAPLLINSPQPNIKLILTQASDECHEKGREISTSTRWQVKDQPADGALRLIGGPKSRPTGVFTMTKSGVYVEM